MKEGRQEGKQEGLREGVKKAVLRLRDKIRWEAEQIADVLEVPLDKVRCYIEQNESINPNKVH